MSQSYFQIYFIFVLCALIEVNCGILHEHGTTEAEFLSSVEPRINCVERICTCADIPKWDGVVCELDNRSLFPLLGFWRFKHLSEKMFQGLRIYSLHLWDPDTTVDENVFEGILGLTRFYVNQSSIKVVPDLRIVKDSITLIEMRSSLITSLEGKHLQNLTSVSFLSFFGNLIRYIDPDVFLGTYNVVTLHLSNNKLTSIPHNLLNPMKRLATFSAMYNNLLHVDNLFSVARPLNIFLGFNNITNFSLTQNVENSRWDYIAELDLRNNFIQETSLSLSACILNNDSILEIRVLNLNGNKLRNLNDVLKCLQNKKLEIARNQIQFLTEKDFISVYKTEQLLLHNNQIHRIDTHTFKPFNTSLQGLYLSSNQITSINGSVKYLSNLIWLDLSHNSIQTFTEDEFTGLHSLLALTFEHNQIKSLGMRLQKLEKLQFLNIIHNDIELIKPDQIPKTLKSMELADNPFKCDCNGLPFYKMLHQWRDKGFCLRSELVNSVRKHLNCPDVCSCKCTEYGGGLSMFVDCSSRNLSLVPHFMENNLTQLQVNEMFSSDDRRYRVMYQNIDPILHLEDNVLGVSLENNILDILDDAQLPPNLVQLYLSNNKLMRFPQSVIDNQLNLKQVSLSGNPWKCDCDSLKFKKWLTSNSHIIKDYDNVRCGESDIGETNLNGTVLWELSDLDLCPGLNLTLVFSVLFAVLSFLAFCIFAKVVYTVYELNIKIFLYSHGITSVKEEILDYDKVFDAFISFSYKDDEFVIQDIISEIENRDPNIRLCLHYRHFRPGVPITDNITHAVQKSKRTVVILSRNFLESEWCLLEFEIAHNQTLQDKVSRIIVVKLEELPKEIEPTIKLYLKSTTYLTWGESNFWSKLLHVLPSQSSVNMPVLRFVGDKEICV